jgi:phage/plasmid-associated DNA primase
MSLLEEFCAALKDGNIGFFADVLEVSVSNTFNASEIMTAQRVIKNWIKETQEDYSIIPTEHLRTIYHVQTEQTPRLSQREFVKKIERNGVKRIRKRPVGSKNSNPIKGVEVMWNIDQEQYDQLVATYFTEKDGKLLETVTH